jgi:DNA polymerase III alpha subunit
MAYIRLEDKSGIIEGTLFPKAFEKCQDMLDDPIKPLLIKGKLEIIKQEEESTKKLIIDSIQAYQIFATPKKQPINIPLSNSGIDVLRAIVKQNSSKEISLDVLFEGHSGVLYKPERSKAI